MRNGAEYLEYLREAERSYIYDGEGGYSIDPSCGYPSMEPNWEYDQRMEYVKKIIQDMYLNLYVVLGRVVHMILQSCAHLIGKVLVCEIRQFHITTI